ncbi:MAG TPA: hypothetical protein VFC38_09080 [Stellaceae bacterium]|nr:hypothetical protein [Stellaceae bacterium]
MPTPRRAICIFCDDIRQEISNKISIIGMYHGDMIFLAAPPILVPKLFLLVSIISDPDDTPKKLTTTILAPDKTEIYRTTLEEIGEYRHIEGSVTAQLRTWFPLPPFVAANPGAIEVWAETESEKLRAGRLFVSFQPPEQQTIDVKDDKQAKAS